MSDPFKDKVNKHWPGCTTTDRGEIVSANGTKLAYIKKHESKNGDIVIYYEVRSITEIAKDNLSDPSFRENSVAQIADTFEDDGWRN